MAATFNNHINFHGEPAYETTLNHRPIQASKRNGIYPEWYSPETGVYHSKHPPQHLPPDPFLDLVSFIFSHQQMSLSSTAFIDSSSGCSISYKEFFPMVKSMASGLHKRGISQGDVVLILLPNTIYFPIVFFGAMYLGAVVTTMNPLSSIQEIKKQTADSGATLALTLPENVGKLEAIGIPVVEVPSSSALYNKLALSSDFDLPPRPLIKQEDPAAIMYSSGTTGASKGVVLTHKSIISMVQLFVRFEASQYEYPSSKNVYLAVIPMFHIYGLSLFVTGLLSLGSSIVVMRKFDIDEVVKVIDRYKVTHFPVVPPILVALTKRAKQDISEGGTSISARSFNSLKQISSGAAPLSEKTVQDFVQTLPHVDFIQGYGMTESTAVGTRGFNTEKFQKYDSVGLLAPNMEAKVVDWETGSFLPPGSSGELWLRGPAIMKGYLNNEEATKCTIDEEGWLRTGDMVYFDQDGYLHISDRLKDIIKYKGFQIAPADLEAVLISHPEIIDVAVTAAMDEEAGEIPVAFVVRKAGSLLSQEAVINYVSQKVAPHKKVRKVVFTHSIPRSAAGKILRRQLRNYLPSRL